MKTQLKTLFSLIIAGILLLPSLIIPQSAWADGIIIEPDPYPGRWDYSDESNQQAFINYEDGLEKIILSVGIEETGRDAVWIFPVPAKPNKVVIDTVTKLPQLNGEEITKKAKLNLLDINKTLLKTQIYTIPFSKLWKYEGGIETPMGMEGIGMGSGTRKQAVETDTIVYEHLEKEGITTEIITAKTAQGLYQYLKRKGLAIKQGSIPVLNHYIGKEFTFVVSWISKTNIGSPEFQSKQRGVFVTFPTQKIYYPLLPTSVYGSKVVPASIRIIGHRSPKIFKDIKNYTKVEYFVNNVDDSYNGWPPREHYSKSEWPKNFYNGPIKNVKYTKIEIEAPSKFLTDDLWISPRAPLKTYYFSSIAQHPLIIEILLLILSSIITSIMVGWIVFEELRNKNGILKLALVGLSNCLSIIGLIMATVLFRTKAKDENITPLLNEIRQKGYIWKRRLAVILFFTIFLPLHPAILASIADTFPIEDFLRSAPGIVLFLTIFVIPYLVLAFILFIKRIKLEDASLFIQLKSAGYSSWSFNPKDKMKFIFVPFFSVSFLAISWLIVKLIEFTV